MEAQLSEAQSHIAEDTARVQELSEQCDKLKVCETLLYMYMYCVYLFIVLYILLLYESFRKCKNMYVCIICIHVIMCIMCPVLCLYHNYVYNVHVVTSIT